MNNSKPDVDPKVPDGGGPSLRTLPIVLLPFLVIFLSSGLKLASIDQENISIYACSAEFITDKTNNFTKCRERHIIFLLENYVNPLWIEFLIVGYLLPIGSLMRGDKFNNSVTVAMFISPVIVFIVSMSFFLLVRIFLVDPNYWVAIGIPTSISAGVLVLIGLLVRTGKNHGSSIQSTGTSDN